MALAPQHILDDRRLAADALVAEVRRYLEAVDAFRAAGFPPSWRAEQRRPA